MFIDTIWCFNKMILHYSTSDHIRNMLRDFPVRTFEPEQVVKETSSKTQGGCVFRGKLTDVNIRAVKSINWRGAINQVGRRQNDGCWKSFQRSCLVQDPRD